MHYDTEHSHHDEDVCSEVLDFGDSLLVDALFSNFFPSSPLNETFFLGEVLVGDLNSSRSFNLLFASLFFTTSSSLSLLARLLTGFFLTVETFFAFGVDVLGVAFALLVLALALLFDRAVLLARGVFTGLGVVKFLLPPVLEAREGDVVTRVGVRLRLRLRGRSLVLNLDLELRLGVGFDERLGERERLLVEAAPLAIRGESRKKVELTTDEKKFWRLY